MNPSQGLASDTLIRTTAGVKRIGDVQIGDYLYDEGNQPALCTGVAPPATGKLKEITYQEFDSRAMSSFTCTPDHRLALTTTGTRPSFCVTNNSVTWYTRCDRKLPVKEACDLHLDILSDYFYQDLVHRDNHPERAAVHAYIETVLDQQYHPGRQDKYSKCIDDYLELADAPDLVRGAREAIHASMDSYLEQLYTRRAEVEEVDSTDEVCVEVDSTDAVFDIDEPIKLTGNPNAPQAEYFFPEKPFLELDLPSSQSTESYFPSSQLPQLDNVAEDRFAAVRKSLEIDCDCGGVRTVCRRFKTEEQAKLALKFLQSDHHHLLDPQIVSDGHEFSMTVEAYEQLCCKVVKRHHLKLYRAPLAFDPSSANSRALAVDPYFLGSWLGDGTASCAQITAAVFDPEIPVWLESYVDRLNSSRPPGANELYLARHLSSAVGTYRNYDVFHYQIACPRGGPGHYSNPVLKGLQKLGVINNKRAGIPPEYMEADEDARLAVIAGLIDSDGTYRKRDNQYRFVQMTEGHKKIVFDLKELASSCGISVTGVDIEMRKVPTGTAPAYVVYLGKGSEKFQKHLLLPRKKMNLEKIYSNHDARPCTVSDAPTGAYRAIEVTGGQFQLANRLVVYN
ncbi:hypothetical protein V1506DRAFT_512704 [Lipomyces tetrasporus]